jgi:hypothetical protein
MIVLVRISRSVWKMIKNDGDRIIIAVAVMMMAVFLCMTFEIGLLNSRVKDIQSVAENQEKVIEEQKELISEINWKKYKKQLRKEVIKVVEKDIANE